MNRTIEKTFLHMRPHAEGIRMHHDVEVSLSQLIGHHCDAPAGLRQRPDAVRIAARDADLRARVTQGKRGRASGSAIARNQNRRVAKP